MKLNKFFEIHLVNGCIEGTFTTSKPIPAIHQLNESKRIPFDVTLQKGNDRVTFIVPKHSKKWGQGILRKTLVQTEITVHEIFLRWVPEKEPMFEGFNVKLTPGSDNGGTFKLQVTNPQRFSIWKDQLSSAETMRP